MGITVLEDSVIRAIICGTVISHLRCTDDTTIITEDSNDLGLLVNKVNHARAMLNPAASLTKQLYEIKTII